MRVRINELIAEETGVDVAKVSRDTDRDFWMDAAEAKEYGLIAKVLTARKDLP
jgi:ATP-dependent Clp protease protease subunit